MTAPSVGTGEDLLLETRGISRRYGGTIALKDVTFRAHRNQINVLIGENGAGKSTLMRVLAGVERADTGELFLDGRRVQLRSTREADAHGIAIVHQELSVFPNLDVSENIFAGRELLRASAIVDKDREDGASASALARLGHPLRVQLPVSQLSLGERQLVELARAVARGARLLILDEPTSALSLAETDALFRVLEEMKSKGVTIVYISHRLQELLYLGDTFTVLRSGQVVGEALRADVTREWIVERMSGRASHCGPENTNRTDETTLLSVRHIACASASPRHAPPGSGHGVSFDLRKGEIVGIYGLLGAGRTELLESLAGARPCTGMVMLRNKDVTFKNVNDAVRAGISMVPEDRQRDGLVPELSVRENIALAAGHGMWISRAAESARVRELVKELNIAVNDIELPVTALSGGNQQKVLLARCLLRRPQVLLLDEPTRGVDVGAKAEIYRTLQRLAANGLSILFTSSEIEETRLLADRVLVMCQGSFAAQFQRDSITDEALFAAASPRVSHARPLSYAGADA